MRRFFESSSLSLEDMNKLVKTLQDLGVTETSDLEHVEENDLENSGKTWVQNIITLRNGTKLPARILYLW